MDKLAAGLGGHVRVSLEQLRAAYTAPLPDQAASRSPRASGAAGPDLLAALQHAIQERQVMAPAVSGRMSSTQI